MVTIKGVRPPKLVSSLALGAFVGALAFACGDEASGDDDDGGSSGRTTTPPGSATKDGGPSFDPQFDDDPDGGGTTPPPVGDCTDPNDQGGSEIVAFNLPETSDCDNDFKEAKGISKNKVDVDYFHLVGNDDGPFPVPCSIDADFELTSGAGLELCVYARCKDSTTNAVTGCAFGTPGKSDEGIDGCCDSVRAVPQWDCEELFGDDSAEFFIRVRQTSTNECKPYTIKYRF